MAKEYRRGYEFTRTMRESIKSQNCFTCLGCGEKYTNLEIHHIVPIKVANEKYRKYDKDLFSQREAGICLCYDCHCQIHAEIDAWNPSFRALYFNGLVEYLKDVRRSKRKAVQLSYF